MEPGRFRMKAPQFDGKTSWTNYLLQFNSAENTNGWFDSPQILSPAEQCDHDHTIKHLEKRFGLALGDVFHSQLRGRCQQRKVTLQYLESVIAYVAGGYTERIGSCFRIRGRKEELSEPSFEIARIKRKNPLWKKR